MLKLDTWELVRTTRIKDEMYIIAVVDGMYKHFPIVEKMLIFKYVMLCSSRRNYD
jgi:hypothetical protein